MRDGPVFVTDRGRPAFVLLSVEAYRRLAGTGPSVADSWAQPGAEADFAADFPRLPGAAREPECEADLGA